MAVIKACEIASDFSQDGILKRIKALEERAVKGALGAPLREAESAVSLALDPDKLWHSVVRRLSESDPAVRVLLDSYRARTELDGSVLKVYFPDETACSVVSTVQDRLFEGVKRENSEISKLQILPDRPKGDADIEKIKNLVGEDKVTIVRGGNFNG